jgi:hypothetical protein
MEFYFYSEDKCGVKSVYLAGLKNTKEVIKTVIYTGGDSENKFTKTL